MLYRWLPFENYHKYVSLCPWVVLAYVPCYTNIALVAGLATGTLVFA